MIKCVFCEDIYKNKDFGEVLQIIYKLLDKVCNKKICHEKLIKYSLNIDTNSKHLISELFATITIFHNTDMLLFYLNHINNNFNITCIIDRMVELLYNRVRNYEISIDYEVNIMYLFDNYDFNKTKDNIYNVLSLIPYSFSDKLIKYFINKQTFVSSKYKNKSILNQTIDYYYKLVDTENSDKITSISEVIYIYDTIKLYIKSYEQYIFIIYDILIQYIYKDIINYVIIEYIPIFEN